MLGPMLRRAWIGLASVWAIACACNLGKAVHVDDAAHLEIARHLAAHPANPLSGSLFWGDTNEPIFNANQPHLFFYLLAGCLRLFGTGLLVPHLLEAAFTLGAIVLFHRLASTEAPRHALTLTALVFLAPAFLPGQNLMADVPLLAFALLALDGLYRDVEDPTRARHLFVAALAVGLASLTKYTGLALLPVLGLAALRGPQRTRRLLVAALPIVMLAAWSLFNYVDYGAVHLFGRPTPRPSPTMLAVRGFEWLTVLGSVATCSLLVAPWVTRDRIGQLVLGAALVAGTALAMTGVRLGHGVGPSALMGAFAANGVVLVAWLVLDRPVALSVDALARRDLLLAWIASLAAFIVVLSPFVAARHVLPVMPAFVLLLAQRTIRRGLLRTATAIGIGLGVALALSDAIWASTYPAEIDRLRARYADDRIVVVGHWGWQWYATRAGFALYDPEAPSPPEDTIVVVPRLAHKQRIERTMRARLRLIGTDEYPSGPATFVRTMSSEPWGGFYESAVDAPSWSVTRQPLEAFDVYRLR